MPCTQTTMIPPDEQWELLWLLSRTRAFAYSIHVVAHRPEDQTPRTAKPFAGLRISSNRECASESTAPQPRVSTPRRPSSLGWFPQPSASKLGCIQPTPSRASRLISPEAFTSSLLIPRKLQYSNSPTGAKIPQLPLKTRNNSADVIPPAVTKDVTSRRLGNPAKNHAKTVGAQIKTWIN